MKDHVFYGEIVTKIISDLFESPDKISEINQNIVFDNDNDNIYTVCSEAARIFDVIVNLSQPCSINIYKAIDNYTSKLLQQLCHDKKPMVIDLIVMAAETIQRLS
jgi:hypothetical protein